MIVVYSSGGAVGWPPLLAPASLVHWWSLRGPITSGMAGLRVLVLLAGGYWLLLLSAAAAARLARFDRALLGLGRVRLLGARRALGLVMGASTAATLLIGCSSPAPVAPDSSRAPVSDAPTLDNLGPWPRAAARATASQPRRTPPRSVDRPPVGRRGVSRLGPRPDRHTSHPGKPSLIPATPITRASNSAAPTSGPRRTWTVRPGDSLWSIAASALAAGSDGPPSEREVATYWLSLIAANRHLLADPDDPNLVYAGETFVLPPVPSPPRPD